MSDFKFQRIKQLEQENDELALEEVENSNKIIIHKGEISEHQREIDKHQREIDKLQNKINELSSRNKDIDEEKEKKSQAIKDLERERYSNRKLRHKLYKYANNSKLPETALKVKKYVSSDAKDIPDDIYDAFTIIEKNKIETESNQKSKMELFSDWTKRIGYHLSDVFIGGEAVEEDEVSNDN